MIRSMNHLSVLRYLNIYDHDSNVNQFSFEDGSKRSGKESIIPKIPMKMEGNYSLMVDMTLV